MDIITMSLGQWGEIEANPRQRNTAERAKRARHLETSCEDQRLVKMAVLPNGRRIKIDGHTRDFFWRELRPDLAPPALLAVVYPVRNLDEAKQLYDACDNIAATENSADKIFGGFRELGFEPVSPFLQRCRIGSGLRRGYGLAQHCSWQQTSATGLHEIVRFWLPELRLIDELRCNPTYWPDAILSAALLSLRKYRGLTAHHAPGQLNRGGRPALDRLETVFAFWDRYNRNEGEKRTREVDPVEALRRLIDQLRNNHRQRASIDYMMARALACVERALAYKHYAIGTAGGVTVKGVELAAYLPRGVPETAEPVEPRHELRQIKRGSSREKAA